jgi:protein-S-isoprenylcysteine O-methyltransferase Ste14
MVDVRPQVFKALASDARRAPAMQMTRSEKLYDALMRVPIVAFDLFFLVREAMGVRSLVAGHPYFDDAAFIVALIARTSIVLFLTATICFHITRYRPVSKYASWHPRVTALAGMLFANLILLTPRAAPSLFYDSVSTILITIGTIVCIVAVLDLGRSLSIMPEARKLVTTGLYRHIRHPLYLGAELGIVGTFLQFRSWQGALILIVHLYLQIRRMHWEEDILAKAFPGYSEYKRQTRRLCPGLY